MGTHLIVLGESYPMNTHITGFRWFSKIFASLCFGRKQPQHWKGFIKFFHFGVTYFHGRAVRGSLAQAGQYYKDFSASQNVC